MPTWLILLIISTIFFSITLSAFKIKYWQYLVLTAIFSLLCPMAASFLQPSLSLIVVVLFEISANILAYIVGCKIFYKTL